MQNQNTTDSNGSRPNLTVKKVATLIPAHEISVRRWIKEGRINALRFGRLVRISADEFDRFQREGSAI